MCAGACDTRALPSAAGPASARASAWPIGASLHPSSTPPASRTASEATAALNHVLLDTALAPASAENGLTPARALVEKGSTGAAPEQSTRLMIVLPEIGPSGSTLAPVALPQKRRHDQQAVAAATQTSTWTLPLVGLSMRVAGIRRPPTTDGFGPTCQDGISPLHADGRSRVQRPVDGRTDCRVDAARADLHRAGSGAAFALAADLARRRCARRLN